jgi:hypothetical protein
MPRTRKTTAQRREFTDPQQGIEKLRRVWEQAMEDNSPGVPADEVLDRLERKYLELATSGTPPRTPRNSPIAALRSRYR